MDTPLPSPRRGRLVLALAGGLAALAAAGGWLAASDSGLDAACRLATWASGGRLVLEGASGRLIGPLQLQSATWSGDDRLHFEDVAGDWHPLELMAGRLVVNRLRVGRLQIEPGPTTAPPTLPLTLRLPVDLQVEALQVAVLARGNERIASDLTAEISGDRDRLRLQGLSAQVAGIRLAGSGEVATESPFALHAAATVAGSLAGQSVALTLTATGTLAAIEMYGVSQGEGGQGSVEASLTPFDAQPFRRLAVRLQGVDPAAWAAGMPAARLDLSADLAPQGTGPLVVAGPVALVNRAPGPLDRHRLPLAALSGRLAWHATGAADLDDLRATLAGGGQLRGSGRWADAALALDMTATGIDAAVLHSRLRPTRLGGSLRAQVAAGRQRLAVDLADPRFRLEGVAILADSRLQVERLRLGAGDAVAEAAGELGLAGGMAYSVRGELARFDPARFARVPAARINASFSAHGSLQPRPAGSFRFALRDSHWAGQPLSGQGEVDLDWPHLRRAEVQLTAGPNRLLAKGAFGRPGEVLVAEMMAPRLDPFGIEGGVEGRLQLSGTLAAPALSLKLAAARLGLPGIGRLRDLAVAADIGARPADALRLEASLAAFDAPGQPGVLQAVTWSVHGSRRDHALAFAGRIAGRGQLRGAGRGGLGEDAARPAWAGQLTALEWQAETAAQRLRLQAAAPLRLGLAHWSVGPAALAGDGWQGSLQASSEAGRLKLAATALGERWGRLAASLEAATAGAWALDRRAPWQGTLQVAMADLAPFGPFLAEGLATGGRLKADLRLGGTPAQPLATGTVEGDGLLVHWPDSGLRLERGELRAGLAGTRLQVSRLAFDSLLQPPPRALVLAADDGDPAGLAVRPGRLEIGGEMAIDPGGGGDSAALDVRLERVGAFQAPQQWVVLSGNGRVAWQEGRLGLSARLAVDAGYWELARLGTPQLSDDVVVKRPGGGAPEARRTPVSLDLEADLGRRFLFRGAGLQSRLAGSVRLRAEGRDLPRASGTIRTVGGRFDAYGQQLAIERGILNFNGLLENPSLNVRAVRRGLPVEPGVEVTGTARRPVVRLVSDPEMADAEKLSWLVLGHGSEQGGAGDASVLLSAAGAILGGESGGVVQQLKRSFGIDEFGVRSGSVGDSGSRLGTSRVAGGNAAAADSTGNQIISVGKRLSSNVVLSYEQALGKTENIVKLTVRLTRGLSLIGRAGSDNALDLFYIFRFGQ